MSRNKTKQKTNKQDTHHTYYVTKYIISSMVYHFCELLFVRCPHFHSGKKMPTEPVCFLLPAAQGVPNRLILFSWLQSSSLKVCKFAIPSSQEAFIPSWNCAYSKFLLLQAREPALWNFLQKNQASESPLHKALVLAPIPLLCGYVRL